MLLCAAACRPTASEAPQPDAAQWATADADPPADDATSPTTDDPDAERQRARPPGTIFRSEIERATGPGPAYLLRQLGPEPMRHDGHFVGWTVTRLFPDDPSLCAPTCDLELGDVILGVNGNRLDTPQRLSDALKALPGWTKLEVHTLRDGQRRRRVYPIVDDRG